MKLTPIFITAAIAARALAAGDPAYSLPLAKPLGKNEAAYVCTYVHHEDGGPAVLALGMPGPHKAWVNGVPVCCDAAAPAKLAPDTSRSAVRLRPGANFLLIKLCGPGKPAFYCKFLGLDGKPLEGSAYREAFRPDAEVDALNWAYIHPFSCHAEARVLDTRFPPERYLAGPPRDASSVCRWALAGAGRPKPSAELLNGDFEFIDTEGRPYAWQPAWGRFEIATDAAQGRRALKLPASERPVSREIKSHPFVVDPRQHAQVSLRYKLPGAGPPRSGVALSAWVQWLGKRSRVIDATPICIVESAKARSADWQLAQTPLLRPPFEAAFARVQLKSWQAQDEVLVDQVLFKHVARGH